MNSQSPNAHFQNFVKKLQKSLNLPKAVTKITLTQVLTVIGFMVLLTGSVVAGYLSQKPQEIRQQASSDACSTSADVCSLNPCCSGYYVTSSCTDYPPIGLGAGLEGVRCAPKKNFPAECSSDDQCSSGSCYANKCRQGIGGLCANDSQCSTGYCTQTSDSPNKRCAPKPNSVSPVCSGGFCAEPGMGCGNFSAVTNSNFCTATGGVSCCPPSGSTGGSSGSNDAPVANDGTCQFDAGETCSSADCINDSQCVGTGGTGSGGTADATPYCEVYPKLRINDQGHDINGTLTVNQGDSFTLRAKIDNMRNGTFQEARFIAKPKDGSATLTLSPATRITDTSQPYEATFKAETPGKSYVHLAVRFNGVDRAICKFDLPVKVISTLVPVTPTVAPTSNPNATATPAPKCGASCSDDRFCQLANRSYYCHKTGGAATGVCRLQSNPTSTTCGGFATSPTPTATPLKIKGSLDQVTCTTMAGWTCDSSNYSQALQVHFYADGEFGKGGRFIASTNANRTREAAVATACGGNANHGYQINLPDSLKDGKSHKIYAYAIGLGSNGNPLLTGSPKTIVCAASTNTPTPSPTATTCNNNSVSECRGLKPGETGGCLPVNGIAHACTLYGSGDCGCRPTSTSTSTPSPSPTTATASSPTPTSTAIGSTTPTPTTAGSTSTATPTVASSTAPVLPAAGGTNSTITAVAATGIIVVIIGAIGLLLLL